RLELRQPAFEQDRVRAEVDELLALHEARDDLVDLRVHQWLAAGDRDDRRSALFGGIPALLRREVRVEDVLRVLDLAATGAREVASIQRLEHEHERIALVALELLLHQITADSDG